MYPNIQILNTLNISQARASLFSGPSYNCCKSCVNQDDKFWAVSPLHKNKRSVAKQRRQENAMSLSLKISQSCQKVENFLMLIVND